MKRWIRTYKIYRFALQLFFDTCTENNTHFPSSVKKVTNKCHWLNLRTHLVYPFNDCIMIFKNRFRIHLWISFFVSFSYITDSMTPKFIVKHDKSNKCIQLRSKESSKKVIRIFYIINKAQHTPTSTLKIKFCFDRSSITVFNSWWTIFTIYEFHNTTTISNKDDAAACTHVTL